MRQFVKGTVVGFLAALLIAVPAFILGQQNTTTGRVYSSIWGMMPSGMGFMVFTSTCPAGSTEVSALDGKMPYGTVAAHGDIGQTGGADSITPTVASLTAAAQTFTGSSATSSAVSAGTPAGSNSAPAFTGTGAVLTGSVAAPTFTGTPFSGVINHTHTITVTSLVQGGTTAATTGTHIMTSTATGGSARAITAGDSITATSANPSGGVASITPAGTNSAPALTMNSYTPQGTVGAPTFTGSALGTHQHTLTPTGTNSTSAVTGTLSQFDNRSAFVKVIYCVKT